MVSGVALRSGLPFAGTLNCIRASCQDEQERASREKPMEASLLSKPQTNNNNKFWGHGVCFCLLFIWIGGLRPLKSWMRTSVMKHWCHDTNPAPGSGWAELACQPPFWEAEGGSESVCATIYKDPERSCSPGPPRLCAVEDWNHKRCYRGSGQS